MNLKQAYQIGFNLGMGMSDTLPEIAAWKLKEQQDDSPVTPDDVAAYVADGFDGYSQHSPWEFTAKEFNESRDSDATWKAFERGRDEGARQAHLWVLSSTKYKRADNIIVPVKNLRWIITHRRDVERLMVIRLKDGASFTAHMSGDRVYQTHFANFDLACKFANRRRFVNATLFSFIGG